MRMKALGLRAPAAPTVPKDGWRAVATSGKNLPAVPAYAPPKYRNAMDPAVKSMPIIPN
jgi:hypothetical protein